MKYYKLIFLLLLFHLSIFACKDTNKSELSSSKHHLTILKNDSSYVIFKNENYFPLQDKVKSTDLSYQELFLIDSLLLVAINDYNKDMESTIEDWRKKNPNIDENYFILHYSHYNYQLVPVINESGEKIIWINSLCKDYNSDGWKKDVYIIMDGGNCFFNLKINLTKKLSYELMVNGVA